MNELRAIPVFILCVICVVSALSGKGHFCRDPDTGFLHPVNSTWPSTTFCGNYTCKLRKKSQIEASEPLREIHITDVDIARSGTNEQTNDNIPIIESPAKKPTAQSATNSPEIALLKSLLSQNDLKKLNINTRPTSGATDRFLTEDEIKNISELLHNVKKSDLEAIVDIYNLAQDIYKEMDKMTTDNIVEEAMKFDSPGIVKTSYWHDPYLNRIEGSADMEFQGSNIVSTTVRPKSIEDNSYFRGPLKKTDFGKLPYYYPMSNFQRQSSYVHNPYPTPLIPKPPCSSQTNNNVPPPLPVATPYNYLLPLPINYAHHPQSYENLLKTPFTSETQKLTHQPNLLPYPFSYIPHYNMSAYPSNAFYDANPWTTLDLTKNKNHKPNYKAYVFEEQNNAITSNDDKEGANSKSGDEEKVKKLNILETLLANSKILTKTRPDWQTDPLPSYVLDEVRAHFDQKSKLLKPLSLRKKVKLEKVGKVSKVDELHRRKRNTEAEVKEEVKEIEGDMETYIEKTTCLSDIYPGFFRMGNLSQPYPACCPQRIDNSS